MKSSTKPFPKTKIQWLWENMEGKRALYLIGMIGTVLYNVLQLTIPYFSGKIVDLFLTGENAVQNLQTHRDLFYRLLIAMIGFTFLRVVIVYGSCMIYEHVSLAGLPPYSSSRTAFASSGRLTRFPPLTGSMTMTGLLCFRQTS